MTAPSSDHGRAFEDFSAGAEIAHPLGRTITKADNIWFTLLTVNGNPIHFDEHYASQTEFKRPLVNSTFTLALVTGLSVNDISRYAINLGWTNVSLPAPLFEDETVYARTRILSVRESKSRPHMGVVALETTGFTAEGKIVIKFERAILVYRRAHVPTIPVPEPARS